MVTFSLLKESWWPVDLRCLLSGRSGLQFASLLWPFKRLLSCLVSSMYWRPQFAHSRRYIIFSVLQLALQCMMNSSPVCVQAALDVFARHTSSRIIFWTLTIVGRSRGDVSSHQDIFQTFGFPESQDVWFFEDFAQFWMFLYGCPVLTNDVG